MPQLKHPSDPPPSLWSNPKSSLVPDEQVLTPPQFKSTVGHLTSLWSKPRRFDHFLGHLLCTALENDHDDGVQGYGVYQLRSAPHGVTRSQIMPPADQPSSLCSLSPSLAPDEQVLISPQIKPLADQPFSLWPHLSSLVPDEQVPTSPHEEQGTSSLHFQS